MTSAQQLEQIFGVPFQQQPDITALRQFHAENTFCENEDGQIIGLCTCENHFEKIKLPAVILPHLEYLNLSDNEQLKQITFEGGLPALKHLDLSDSKVEQLTLPAGMDSLEWLDISRNQLQALTIEGALPRLRYLDLSGNQLPQLSLTAPKLRYAYLLDNQLRDLSFPTAPELLEVLHLKNNQLQKLPDNLLDFKGLKALYLHGNPLPGLPSELIAEGESGNSLEAVKHYLEEFHKGTIINDRAKLIIVGNGRVGKTSIFRRLAGKDFNPLETYTHGVNLGYLHKADLPQVERTDSLLLQVWDFGGQEIFFATHQFFLSEEAVYLLAWTDEQNVLPHRERDKTSLPYDKKWRSNEYWLENIRLRTRESPIVMVQTHSDIIANRKPDQSAWGEEPYKAVALKFSASKDFGLDELRAILGDRLNRAVPMLGREFPKTYDDAIAVIEVLKQNHSSINYDRFLALCREVNIEQGGEDALLEYLVKAGVVVHFDKPLLKEVVYIDPNWLTEQVYALINEELRPRKGVIDLAYLEQILPEPEYDDRKRRQFVELLKAFELIFQPEGEDYYIAPQYLPEQLDANEQKLHDIIFEDLSLGFAFRFPKFLPDNVMINFLSRYGPSSKRIYWKNGICFTNDRKAKCIVHFQEADRRLSVYTQDDETGRELQREICRAFVELSKNANAAISADGETFASWQELERYQPLYLQNTALQFFALDGTTPLYLKDFMRFFGKEGNLEERGSKIFEKPKPIDMEPVRRLVGRNQLKEALDLLMRTAPAQHTDSVALVQRQLQDLDRQKIRGVLSFDQENTERNRIANRVLELAAGLNAPAASLQPEVPLSPITEDAAKGSPPAIKLKNSPPKAFLSYATKVDSRYAQLFMEGISVHSNWDVFQDRQIQIGEDWHERLQKEVQECDFAIFLLSPYFFRSEYIKKHEFEQFIKRKRAEGFPFFSVLLTDCDFKQWEEIARRQIFVAHGQHYDLAKSHRDRAISFDLLARFDRDGELIPNPFLNTFYKNFVQAVDRALNR